MVEEIMVIDLNIDKTNWLPVKFGDVVQEVRKSTGNPEADGLHRIVGLEHIEPENLHLSNWGALADSITFSRVFRKGQMLFGKRRAYLKKAALASFDGICSGDIIVMEAKKGLLPELLPFLICNDKFFEYAVKTSAGSLSPRTKFKDLAEYEFLLPPIEQQSELAELLWAGDEIISNLKSAKETADSLYERSLKTIFSEKSQWPLEYLSSVANINSKTLKANRNLRFKYLDITGIIEPKVVGNLNWYNFSESPSRARRIVQDGSIVLSLVRPYHQSFVLIKDSKDIIASTGTAVIDVNKKALNRFIFHQFFSQRFQEFCKDRMTGTSYPAVTPTDIASFSVFVPNSLDEQLAIANKLDSIDNVINNVNEHIAKSKLLLTFLINQIF